MKQLADPEERTRALLRVAAYLGRPQKFMAVADARAELRHTLELASKGSVILTAHGEPEAAVVPFTTLEDMRRALLHLLVEEMEASFVRSQERLQSSQIASSSDESRLPKPLVEDWSEAEKLVGDVVRKARRTRKATRRTSGR